MAQAAAPGGRTAVIGGSIIGLFCALALQDAGLPVTLVEPGPPGGRQAASYGNGTWVNEGAIMPISLPGLWRSVPGFLLDTSGPFVIRWRHLPWLLPWLTRFVLAGRSWSRIARDLPARAALLQGAVSQYEARAAQAGIEDLLGTPGVMYVYRSRAEFEADRPAWDLRARHGIPCTFHEAADLHALVPELSPDYVLGARILPSRPLRDPGGFCSGLAALFTRRGGVIADTRATGFDIRDGRLHGLRSEAGEIPCTRAVLAAGIGAGPLARQLGDRVPMIAERGYHIVVRDCPVRPAISLMPADGKMAVASTPAGLRLAGQVELAAPSASPDWARARIQLHHARRLFPQAAAAIEAGPHDLWMGSRPSTPDGLPVIAPARDCVDVMLAFGHGHTGMTMAPATARLVRELLTGHPPHIDPRPYSATRFRHAS